MKPFKIGKDTPEDIIREYEVSEEDIRAALSYAVGGCRYLRIQYVNIMPA